MPELRVNSFGVSIDGYAAGPQQDLDNPLGVGGLALHEWLFGTRTFHQITGEEGGEIGTDDDFGARGFENVGSWIIGRNMFGPIRGPWDDNTWKGWWGDEPPFHTPVLILTHYPRKPIEMLGGTTFYFVTDGIHVALERAFAAANGKDVRIGGGAATVRQYLKERLIDEMHLAVAPVLLGDGEHFYDGLDLPALGYRCVESVPTANATHVIVRKQLS
jgi:dihydrofolate reductase